MQTAVQAISCFRYLFSHPLLPIRQMGEQADQLSGKQKKGSAEWIKATLYSVPQCSPRTQKL
jgi:hypothetical protein